MYFCNSFLHEHNAMIKITDSAKKRLNHLLEAQGKKDSYVRVGVESGGCSGLSYKLDFDNTKNDDDEIIENNGHTGFILKYHKENN